MLRPETKTVVASADLAMVLGFEFAEVDLWRDHLGHNAPMMWVDIDPDVLSDAQNAAVRIPMRVEDFVSALIDKLCGYCQKSKWNARDFVRYRFLWRAEADRIYSGLISAIETVQHAMLQDALIYSDMTQFAYLAKEVWDEHIPEDGIIPLASALWAMHSRRPL